MAKTLSDRPGEWTEVESSWGGKYQQRWVAGAFGDLPDIRHVTGFEVTREAWDDSIDPPARTILEARIVEADWFI